ncbi:hypothetical protein [Gluconacetobacter diazotrophicus]|nr:hypothetical protein [Gluconacetobacter diazotrophicus]
MTAMIKKTWWKVGSFFFSMLIVLLVHGVEIFEKIRSRHAQRES